MEYKAFRIGALFEKLNAPYIGAGRKQDNVSKERTEEFSLPLINCKWGDNGIMYYGRPLFTMKMSFLLFITVRLRLARFMHSR